MAAGWDKLPFLLTDYHANVAAVDIRRDRAAGIEPIHVLIALALVLIKRRASTSPVRIDQVSQRVGLLVAGVMHPRPQRPYRIGSHEDSRLAQRGMGQNVGRAINTRAGPPVKPAPGRNVDVAMLHTRTRDRRHQQSVTAQKLIIHRVRGLIVRIGPEQWAQYRRSSAVTLLEERVEIRQKTLAQLEHVAADGFVWFTKSPRLLAARCFFRVIATERLKNAKFRPAGKQLPARVSVITADIDPRPAHAGEPKILELGEAHGEVLPRG